MNFQKVLFFSLLLFSLGTSVLVRAQSELVVGNAAVKKPVLMLVLPRGDKDLAERVLSTVKEDMDFIDLYDVKNSAEIDGSQIIRAIKHEPWKAQGITYVIKSEITAVSKTLTRAQFVIYQVQAGQEMSMKTVTSGNVTRLGHVMADEILKTISGNNSPTFDTRLAFVCNGTSNKEIYIADYDGANVKRMTSRRSISLAPAFSPDGKQMGFSSYVRHPHGSNLDLFLVDLVSPGYPVRVLSNRKGINSGLSFMPNGNTVAATMSFNGNPDIYELDLKGNIVKLLARNIGFDVDPSFSPDGKTMVFVSSRSGQPMVWKMDLISGNMTRLTFAGKYNASPVFSSDGNKILFAGWDNGHFDLFMMGTDGNNLERLTKNQGSNEDPQFSPDGRMLVYASNRSKGWGIYIMNALGTKEKRVTQGLGDCTDAAWGKVP